MSDNVVGVGGMLERSVDETEALIQQVLAQTEAEQAEWSDKLVAMEHWRWVAGMTTRDREVVCAVANNGILRLYSPSTKRIVERLAEQCRPNLVDPMTVLAIINLVRVAYPMRDFVVQFPAVVPFHDLAHHIIRYLSGDTGDYVCSTKGTGDDAAQPEEG